MIKNGRPFGLPFFNEYHMSTSDRLQRMYLCAFWSIVLPNHLLVLSDFHYAILVSNQDITIGQENSIADFSTSASIMVFPAYLSVFDNKHSWIHALTSIEEIVTTKRFILRKRGCTQKNEGYCTCKSQKCSHNINV